MDLDVIEHRAGSAGGDDDGHAGVGDLVIVNFDVLQGAGGLRAVDDADPAGAIDDVVAEVEILRFDDDDGFEAVGGVEQTDVSKPEVGEGQVGSVDVQEGNSLLRAIEDWGRPVGACVPTLVGGVDVRIAGSATLLDVQRQDGGGPGDSTFEDEFVAGRVAVGGGEARHTWREFPWRRCGESGIAVGAGGEIDVVSVGRCAGSDYSEEHEN